MAAVRRERGKKPGVLVRFQPWLIAGGVILNVVASGAAAVSAYFAYKQSDLAIEAVNRANRNDAFSELVKAHDALCSVSPVGLVYSYFPNVSKKGLFEEVDYEAMESRRSSFNVEDYLARWEQANNLREQKYLYFEIWMKPEERDEFHAMRFNMGVGHYRDTITNSKAPPEVEIIKEKTQCTSRLYAGMDFYNSADANKSMEQFAGVDDVYIWPRSAKGLALEKMLQDWGYEDTYKTLDEHLIEMELVTDEQRNSGIAE